MIEQEKEATQTRNEYHIHHVENFYPNATTIINLYGDGRSLHPFHTSPRARVILNNVRARIETLTNPAK